MRRLFVLRSETIVKNTSSLSDSREIDRGKNVEWERHAVLNCYAQVTRGIESEI